MLNISNSFSKLTSRSLSLPVYSYKGKLSNKNLVSWLVGLTSLCVPNGAQYMQRNQVRTCVYQVSTIPKTLPLFSMTQRRLLYTHLHIRYRMAYQKAFVSMNENEEKQEYKRRFKRSTQNASILDNSSTVVHQCRIQFVIKDDDVDS